MEVSLIILTFNSSGHISELLEQLISKYKEELTDKRLEILVADNDSKDDTVALCKKFKEIKVIETGRNYGYAKGNNIASKNARGEFLVFLNPDTQIVSGSIFDLVSEFTDERVGIVGGKILNHNQGTELSCGKTYNWFNTILLSLGLEETFRVRFAPDKKKSVAFVSGAFFAVRRELFEKLHGFDDHYFMYIEDADLCFRVKKAGYKIMFSPRAVISHIGQGSSNRAFAIVNIYKGLVYFQKKHMSNTSYQAVVFFLSLKAILLVLLGKISNNYYLVSTYEEAYKAIR